MAVSDTKKGGMGTWPPIGTPDDPEERALAISELAAKAVRYYCWVWKVTSGVADLIQEVAIAVWNRVHERRSGTPMTLKRYVKFRAKEKVSEHIGRLIRRGEVELVPDAVFEEIPTIQEQIETSQIMEQAMNTLSADDRRLGELSWKYELSSAEIARELGISEGAVRTRRSRLRAKLRPYLNNALGLPQEANRDEEDNEE